MFYYMYTHMRQTIDSNIRHEAVPVPSGSCPLNEHALLLFENGLQLLSASGELPSGYGATPEELGRDGFIEQEEIVIGIQRRGYAMQLPQQIWKARMEGWARGLYVLQTILSTTD